MMTAVQALRYAQPCGAEGASAVLEAGKYVKGSTAHEATPCFLTWRITETDFDRTSLDWNDITHCHCKMYNRGTVGTS